MIKLIKNIFSNNSTTQTRIILSKDGKFYPQVKKFLLFWCYCHTKNPSYRQAAFDEIPVPKFFVTAFSTQEEAMSYLAEVVLNKPKKTKDTVIWKSA